MVLTRTRNTELATDSRGEVATDSYGEVATDSRGELATDSRGEVAPVSRGEVAPDSQEENEVLCPSVGEFRDMDWFLERKMGNFDGENPSGWANFVTAFENVCRTKGWDRIGEETLVELITSRLSGKARKAWEEWYQDVMISEFSKRS